LAQFPSQEQCTLGVIAAVKYWSAIKVQQNVFESGTAWHFDNFDHTSCLRLSEAPTIFSSFSDRGGFCDPSPGANSYKFEVDAARIRDSGMQLWVVATSLNSSMPKWWNEKSENIIDGVLASGALAPLLYPKIIDGEWFIDGGLVANTPILKAVQDGAEEILVMFSSPLQVPEVQLRKPLGMSIVEYELELFMFKYFVESELEHACHFGKGRPVRIWGYAPEKELSSMMDFEAAKIESMRQMGLDMGRRAQPVDLCVWLKAAKALPRPQAGAEEEMDDSEDVEEYVESVHARSLDPPPLAAALLALAAAAAAYFMGVMYGHLWSEIALSADGSSRVSGLTPAGGQGCNEPCNLDLARAPLLPQSHGHLRS